jgi:FtsP/CotA-like multicopper oxidase with cupredoxin domain
MKFFSSRVQRLIAGAVFFVPFFARAQEEPLPAIRPTITVESGDLGGTFFGQKPPAEKTRHYYVAAESELWDFVPAGRDEICGLPLPPPVVANRRASKLRYVQYTDATFSAKVIPNRSLGILGPVLRGVVGDYLVITFLNRTSQPLSMHPHGVKYDKDSEGAYYMPGPGRGGAIGPGATFTYVWHLDEASGPSADEPSSKAWLYHSHVSGDVETNLGLVGCIIVTDPKRARPDGTPRDVDREFATLFMIFDESGLDAAAVEAAEYAGLPGLQSNAPPLSWAEVQQSLQQGERHAINGYLFGNLHGLEMNEGERTRWYVFGLGNENDFHTAHWHGLRVLEEGRRRTDVVDLLPATMKVADLNADNPGTWLYHCHVAEHMREGMFARVVVYPRGAVGADRSAANAFLGHPQAAHSMRIDRAEALLNLAAVPARAELVIEGVVTVFEAFSVFNQPIRIQLGERSLTFKPDQRGIAKEPRAMFRVKNANEFGVINSGLMEFELELNGADWLTELAPPTTTDPAVAAASTREVPVGFDIGRVHHTATAKIVRRMQRR